ncbi:sulfatase [Sphingobacterium sp. SGG-5]|uniref:sulfatase family protein n=1 Tax=Sphingobacterium sp. SGG-5 TaxID=2710881 RepID=UPI001F0F9842|nr:sulfatase [Sphingobacterium sp. SGG-5]
MKLYIAAFFFLWHISIGCAQDRPNILWITIEDTSPHFIGCYGNEEAKTPNIDRLAAEGVRFTGAFSTNTVCSPSRTALITGVPTFEAGTGHHRSKYPVPDFMHGFPYYMQQSGYYTSNNFKTDYNVADAKSYVADAWDESSKTAGWWNRRPGQPFFAVFNYMDSHQSRTMTSPYEKYTNDVLGELSLDERIGDADFQMPPFLHDSPEMRKQFARVYNALKLTDNKIGELLQRLEKDHLTDSTIIFFFSDHGEGIPKGKTNGINLGYRVPFVVWFPPMYRHLSPWGTGVVTDELVSFEDLAPTLIALTEGKVPAHMKGRILIGKQRSEPVSFLELSSDRSDNGIDLVRSITDGRYMYSRNYMPFMPQVRYINYMEISEIKQQMRQDLADGKLNSPQKELFEHRPAEFLFDTEKDPWEIHNLADDPHYYSQLAQMRTQLEQSILQSRDVMFLPEYELAEIARTGTAYEYRMDDARYPIKDIYAAAKLSGTRGKETAVRQMELLTHKNKIVRYWAALGLRSQDKNLLQAYRSQLISKIHDAYLPVSITMAAIVYDTFADKEAEEIIKQTAASANPHAALMALNYLLYLANPEPFVVGVRTISERSHLNENVDWACKDFLTRVKNRH